jgi:integrase
MPGIVEPRRPGLLVKPAAAAGKLTANPFGRLPKLPEGSDARRVRRALTPEELQRLLYAAQWRPLAEYGRPTIRKLGSERRANKRSRATWRRDALTFEQLPQAVERARQRLRPDVIAKLQRLGRERALVYKTLVLTGLRYGELRSIRLAQVHLDGPLPHLLLQAADAKSGQAAEIPLRADLAADLKSFLSEQAALQGAEEKKRGTRYPWQRRTRYSGPLMRSGGGLGQSVPASDKVWGLMRRPSGCWRIGRCSSCRTG